MSIEKMREEFEAWLRLKHPTASLRKCEPEDGYVFSVGQYMEIRVQDVWLGWQASRESLVITLPKEAKGWSPDECAEADGFNDGVDRCRSAIEAAGLKVTP